MKIDRLSFLEERGIKTQDMAGLAIDGGGIRGIVPAILLEHLASKGVANRPLHRIFDVIGGTSIGGIIALGATIPNASQGTHPCLSEKDLKSLFWEKSDTIFPRGNILRRFFSPFLQLFTSTYDPKPLEGLLQGYFKNSTLADALTNVIVVASDNDLQQPFIFSSREAKALPVRNYEAWKVGRSTSAAPTYFPSFRPTVLDVVSPQPELVDGGLYANNPAMEVAVEMRKIAEDRDSLTLAENYIMLSLGTGCSRLPQHTFSFKAGLLSAIRPAVEMPMQASSLGIHNAMKTFLREDRYKRVNIDLGDTVIDLDEGNKENLIYLTQKAEEKKDEIEKFYEETLRPFLEKKD